jgi:transposase-like protein
MQWGEFDERAFFASPGACGSALLSALPYGPGRGGRDQLLQQGDRSGRTEGQGDRGLEGVELVISDAHKGIQKAVESSFVGASWQYCHVHHSRAVLESIPNKDKQEIADKLKEASDDEIKMQELAKDLRDRGYDPAAETIDRFRFDLWNYKAYPKAHWKRIRTTNIIERINKELKRRSRPVGAFPSDQSLMRLAGRIMININ